MTIDFLSIAIILVVVLASMTLHEAMHGYVAYWLGDDTARLQGRLTLNPLKHIDPFLTVILPILLAVAGLPIFGGAKPVPFNPNNVRGGEWGAALIAVAGPLTNFLIAFFGFGIWVLFGTPVGTVGQVFQTIVTVNLGFMIFNLIPIPPLDGSRVLYALAPDFVRKGMQYIERFGIFVVFALVLIGSAYIATFIVSIESAIIWLFNAIFVH